MENSEQCERTPPGKMQMMLIACQQCAYAQGRQPNSLLDATFNCSNIRILNKDNNACSIRNADSTILTVKVNLYRLTWSHMDVCNRLTWMQFKIRNVFLQLPP